MKAGLQPFSVCVVGGWYFVLREDDPHAKVALLAYANSCEADYPELAADLHEKARMTPPAQRLFDTLPQQVRDAIGTAEYALMTTGEETRREALEVLEALRKTPNAGIIPTAETAPLLRGWMSCCGRLTLVNVRDGELVQCPRCCVSFTARVSGSTDGGSRV